MAACNIDSSKSPHFNDLREHWKQHGYPSIDADLNDAFANIRRNINANQCRRVPRFSAILQGKQLFKYRQRIGAAREGASGGWRIYAIYDQNSATLYPIIVYPKKVMADADDDTIRASVTALLDVFQRSLFENSK